jgi:hypothetical protein
MYLPGIDRRQMPVGGGHLDLRNPAPNAIAAAWHVTLG